MSVYNCCSQCTRPKNEYDKMWCNCTVKDSEHSKRWGDNYQAFHQAVLDNTVVGIEEDI